MNTAVYVSSEKLAKRNELRSGQIDKLTKIHALLSYIALLVLSPVLILSSGQRSTFAQSPVNGVWISKSELMTLPTSGPQWDEMKKIADSQLGDGNIGDQDSNHDIYTLATALVAARTGDPFYRNKTIEALLSVVGTDELADSHCDYVPSRARSLAIARNFTAYIIASDLIDFRDGTDAGKGTSWQHYVDMLRFKSNCPNTGSGTYSDGKWFTLSESHDSGASNADAQAGAARIAAALYLNDHAELDKAWATYQRYAGDRSMCRTCFMNITSAGLTWAYDAERPVAVNPAGSTKNGHNIDGAIVNDMSRGGRFAWPPAYTGYPWVGLEGFVAQAHMLARAGYPAWQASNQAPLRAVAYLKYLSVEFGSKWWDRTDWVKYVVNHAYPETDFDAKSARSGFIMAWTDWLYIESASTETTGGRDKISYDVELDHRLFMPMIEH